MKKVRQFWHYLTSTLVGRFVVVFYATLLFTIIAEYGVLRYLSERQVLLSSQQSGWSIASEIAHSIPKSDPDLISRHLSEIKFINPNIEIYLIAESGKILFSTVQDYFFAPRPHLQNYRFPLSEVVAFLDASDKLDRGFPVFGPVPHRPERLVIYSAAWTRLLGQRVLVYVPLQADEYSAMLRQGEARYLVFGALFSLGALFFIAIAIGTLVFVLLSRRFKAFGVGVARISAGDLSFRLDARGTDEISDLARQVNSMADSLIHSLDTLEQESAWREEMIAALSHDFKSPLAGINARVQRLLSSFRSDDEEKTESYLKSILLSSERMNEAIAKSLGQFKDDAKTYQPIKERISLSDLLKKDVIEPLEPIAMLRGVTISLEQDSDDASVSGDPKLLRHAFMNLVDNAIFYNKEDGRIDITLSCSRTHITVVIADTGAGIQDSEKEKVFARFYRGSASQEFSKTGTGLGLSIVKGIVDAHDGSINLESEVDEGTTVTVVLPIE